MRVLISGVNGFLGQAISERLIKDGHEVHGLITREERNSKTPNVIAHKGNLLNYTLIGYILKKLQPEMIIHLAARTEVEKSFYDPLDFSIVNYIGTINLIEKAKEFPNLKLFLFASTMETYGRVYTRKQVLEQPEILKPFDEKTRQKPNAPYAVAKVGCEYYLKYAKRAYKFPFCALRQTNTYGRKDNDFFVVEQIITQMLKNKEEINLGYGEPWRNFLYIDDLVDLYSAIVANPDKVKGKIFTIGPDNALPISELVKKIAFNLGWNGKVNWNTKRKRVGEVYYLNSVATKIEQVLGWSPKTTLDDGLTKTIEYWKSKIC
jgi:UDP-glucose 4-epimerase